MGIMTSTTMGRRVAAVFIASTLLVASLALIVLSGGNGSLVKESETLTTDESSGGGTEVYVSGDGGLRAYLSGTAELPVVTVVGDTHSSELPSAHTPTMDGYFDWVERNVTDGTNLREDYNFGCSSFESVTDSGHYVGRTEDYAGTTRYPMVFKCIPDNGYASIGLTYKALLFDNDATMEDMMASPSLAAAPMAALDGMNEKGLTCSILCVGYQSEYQTKEGSLFAIGMLRYVLDFADSVETAERLITEIGYSCAFGGSALHLFITDKDGNSVAVECIGGELHFTETDYITNHYISPDVPSPPSTDNSVVRLETMKRIIGDAGNGVTLDVCRDALDAVSGGGTTYAIVFDVDNLTLNVWYYRSYDVDPEVYDINQLVAVKGVEDTEDDDDQD